MYRSKDFILMDVININGKRIGFIDDILVDFHSGYVTGFSISASKLFKKSISVEKENILTFNGKMVVNKISYNKFLKFSDFKGMDVIDCNGNIIGMFEDIIFNSYDFKINGVIISRGFLGNIISGKRVHLIKDLILGDKNILYFGGSDNIKFITLPHEILGADK